jgi:hypothetical protein
MSCLFSSDISSWLSTSCAGVPGEPGVPGVSNDIWDSESNCEGGDISCWTELKRTDGMAWVALESLVAMIAFPDVEARIRGDDMQQRWEAPIKKTPGSE